MDEIETASSMIAEQAHEDANIIWGAAFDENMEDEMSVTVIATGFDTHDGMPTVDEKAEAESGTGEEKSATKSSSDTGFDEDKDFIDIMDIFNRK